MFIALHEVKSLKKGAGSFHPLNQIFVILPFEEKREYKTKIKTPRNEGCTSPKCSQKYYLTIQKSAFVPTL